MPDGHPSSRRAFLRRHGLAVAVAILGALATIALWRIAAFTEREAVDRVVATETVVIGNQLLSQVAAREQAIERMTERWRVQSRSHEPEWRSDARLYARDYDGMRAFAWIGPEGALRWVEPRAARSTFEGLLEDPGVRDAVERGTPDRAVEVVYPAAERETAIRLYPLTAGEDPDGTIALIVDHRAMLDSTFPPAMTDGYAVTIGDGAHAHAVRAGGVEPDAPFVHRTTIEAADRRWELAVAPLPATVDSVETAVDELVLAFGLVASALFGLAVAMARRARERERELRDTETMMERIHASLPVVVAVHRPDLSEVLYLNPRFESLYGVPADAILEDPSVFVDLVHSDDRERIEGAIERDLPHGDFEEEYRIVRPDGEMRWVEAWSETLERDEGPSGLVITVAQDVTERKRAEFELRRSNEELQQFAYVASHDLQEPLRMVTSYLQLIERRYADRLDEKGSRFIDFAVDGAERMKRLINGLLQYSRVHTQGERLTLTDVDEVLDEALANLRAPLRESGATIRREDLPVVPVDASQLALVFQNLISNAIKFRDGDAPEIEIEVAERPEAWLFSVSDDGVGFDPELSDQMFVLFRRLHGRDEYSGTGIGLALCRRVVERHGGRIWAESEPGEGSTFYFTLPKRPEERST